MKRFLNCILIITAAISAIVFTFCVVQRIQRRDWVITTAEITFVELPQGIVCGTFDDTDGITHTDFILYQDAGFGSKNLIRGGAWIDPEPFYGTTTRIYYDPEIIFTENGSTRYADNYDQWLCACIGSGVCLAAALAVIIPLKIKARRAEEVERINYEKTVNDLIRALADLRIERLP